MRAASLRKVRPCGIDLRRAGRHATPSVNDGYGALGTEFQVGRSAIRLEARDNVFCYKSPVAGVDSKTRTDIALALGLAYHFR